MRHDQDFPSEAISFVPQGHAPSASSRETPSDDVGHEQRAEEGQSFPSPLSPPFPSEANEQMPKGRRLVALSRELESSDAGQAQLARNGQPARASSLPPNEDAEASLKAPKGHSMSAPASSPESDDVGHVDCAEEGQIATAPSSPPFPSKALHEVSQDQARAALSREPESSDVGHWKAARNGHSNFVSSLLPDEDAEARCSMLQGHMSGASASSPNGGDGHKIGAENGLGLPAITPDVFYDIIAHHRQRNYVMESRKIIDLRLLSFLRTQLGWQREKPAEERERIKAQAKALLEMGEREAKGKPVDTDEPAYLEWHDVIMASVQSRAEYDVLEKKATKAMERLAKTLPVWKSFGEPINGFGARSLALIVGEAGDLSQYETHSKLWKRMGLAVMNGTRQGGLPKGAPKEEWVAHGYNAKRRAVMFVVGEAMIKKQSRYREIYLARKEYERRKAEAAGLVIAPAAKIPKKRAAEFMSLGHIDKRARRYMEKKLLRDLWRAWRNDPEASKHMPDMATPAVPSDRLTQS